MSIKLQVLTLHYLLDVSIWLNRWHLNAPSALPLVPSEPAPPLPWPPPSFTKMKTGSPWLLSLPFMPHLSLHWRWRLWPPLNSLDISISLYHTAPTTTSCLDGFISLLIVCPLVHFPHSQKFKCEHRSYLLFRVSYDSHCPWVKFKLLQWYLRSLCVGCLFKLAQFPPGTYYLSDSKCLADH